MHLNHRGNRWFAIFFLCLSLLFIVDFEELYPIISWIIPAFIDLFLLLPFFLWLTVYSFVTPKADFPKKSLWLLVPFFIISVIIIVEERVKDEFIYFEYLYFTLFSIVWLVTFVLCRRTLQKHQSDIQQINASTEEIDMAWLYRLVLVMPISVLCGGLIMVSADITWLTWVADVFLLIALFYVIYHKLQEQEVYPYQPAKLESIEKILQPNQPVELLKPAECTALRKKFENLLEEEKIYQDKTLSLPKLADKLGVRSHQLSWFINSQYQKKFYHLINGYRIEESKKMLLDPDKKYLSIQGISQEVGFNSKTTFNTHFKKLVGLTPSEYRKSGGKRADLSI